MKPHIYDLIVDQTSYTPGLRGTARLDSRLVIKEPYINCMRADTASKVAHHLTADLARTRMQRHTILWGGMIPKKRMARRPFHVSYRRTFFIQRFRCFFTGFGLLSLHSASASEPPPGCERQRANLGLWSRRRYQLVL
jgi:hypothetical protein